MAVFWVVAPCSLVVYSVVSAYFDCMRAADTIDSQKSEDRDIADKLPQMPLATTKVPRMQSQIFYFHTGKI
jgi:hypothetical protein